MAASCPRFCPERDDVLVRLLRAGCLQEYLKQSGVEYILVLTCAFYDNFINLLSFQKQEDGSFVYGDNLGTEPHSWHAAADVGGTVAGASIFPCLGI